MSRLPRRYLLAPVLAAAAALTLTACGNGGVAVQSNEHTVENGAGAEVGPLDVRDATLTLGGGGVALLAVALYNQSPTADALTNVSGPEGTTFTLPATATAYHGVYTGATPSDTVTVAVTPSSPTSSAAPRTTPGAKSTVARAAAARSTPSSSAAPATQAAASLVAIPGQTGVFLNAGLTQIVVRNLPADVQVGVSIPITFTFLGAGSVTVQVPVTAGVGVDLSGDGPQPTVSTDGAPGGAPGGAVSSAPPVVVTVTATAAAPSGAPPTAP